MFLRDVVAVMNYIRITSLKNSDSLLRSLKSNTIGEPFIQISEVESTNNYAMGQLQNNAAKHGTAWFAHHQTMGKGQRGKTWNSNPSENIILTVAVDTSTLKLNEQFTLSMAVALGAFDFFSFYAGDETSVKWPNDIYWRDRKAAGILIENVVKGTKWQWAVIGIGMNLNQTLFPVTALRPVSLKQITGKSYDAVDAAKELCVKLNVRIQQLYNGETESLLHDYNERLFKRGEKVHLKRDNVFFDARITGVNMYGELIADSILQKNFQFGEVEWII